MSDTEQANWRAVFERFDTFAENYLLEANLAGMSVAFTTRAGLLRAATYGYTDIAARLPVEPETLFEIGSISKSFTAIALLQEHEAGRLELHAPITDYLPWFTVKSEFEPITVHHLLTHTGGIPTGSDASPASPYLVAILCECYASTAPGTAFNYSNAGYQTLGLILEHITGRRYGDIIRERILAPLGMTESEPVITHVLRPRLAVGYTRLYDDRPEHKSHPLVPATWLEYDKGDGSLACTATDLAIYLRCLLNRGEGLISKASFALLTQRGIEISETTAYGYGIEAGMLDGEPCFGHDGGMVGYVSEMIGDLGSGLGVVVLMNAPGDPKRVGAFGLQLLRAALQGKDLPDTSQRPDPIKAENAADYAGTYESGSNMLSFRADRRYALASAWERRNSPRGVGVGYFLHAARSFFTLPLCVQSGCRRWPCARAESRFGLVHKRSLQRPYDL